MSKSDIAEQFEQESVRQLVAVLSNLELSPKLKAQFLEALILPHHANHRRFSLQTSSLREPVRTLSSLLSLHFQHPDFALSSKAQQWLKHVTLAPFNEGLSIPENEIHLAVIDKIARHRELTTISSSRIEQHLACYKSSYLLLNYLTNPTDAPLVLVQAEGNKTLDAGRSAIPRFLQVAAIQWLASDAFDSPVIDVARSQFQNIRSRGSKIANDCKTAFLTQQFPGITVERCKLESNENGYTVDFSLPVVILGKPTEAWLLRFLSPAQVSRAFPIFPKS